MIYQPSPLYFALRESLDLGLKQAGVLALIDFVAQDKKPWAFYAGAALGGTAVATGIPGAAATFYVVGDIVQTYVLKSPDGGIIDVTLDGVAYSSIDTYAAATAWETVQVVLDGNIKQRLDFINIGPSPSNPVPDPISWFAMGPTEVTGTHPASGIEGQTFGQIWRAFYTIKDEKHQKSVLTIYLGTDAPFGQVGEGDAVEFAAQWAVALDPFIRGQITRIIVSAILNPLELPATGSLKTVPDFGSDVEEGAEVTYKTYLNNQYAHRIPTFREDLFHPDGALDQLAYDDLVNSSGDDPLFMLSDAAEHVGEWSVWGVDGRGEMLRPLAYTVRESFKRSR